MYSIGMNIKQLLGLQKEEVSTKGLFGRVIAHDNIKRMLAMALDSEKPIHVCLHGKPGNAKTMLVRAIKERFPEVTEYVIGSDTTKAGLYDLLFEKRNKIKYLIIDEIEYMSKQDQAILLNLLETGILREVKRTVRRETKLTIWVFATCNNFKKLSEPLRTRFLCKYMPAYEYAEFEQIAVGRLMQEHRNMKVDFARAIANAVWDKRGEESNVRDCVRISHMAKTLDEIAFMVEEI